MLWHCVETDWNKLLSGCVPDLRQMRQLPGPEMVQAPGPARLPHAAFMSQQQSCVLTLPSWLYCQLVLPWIKKEESVSTRVSPVLLVDCISTGHITVAMASCPRAPPA